LIQRQYGIPVVHSDMLTASRRKERLLFQLAPLELPVDDAFHNQDRVDYHSRKAKTKGLLVLMTAYVHFLISIKTFLKTLLWTCSFRV
jgi:hypothetical protein